MRARLEYDDKAAFLERVAAWLWTRTAVIVGAAALLTAVSGSASAQTGAVSGIAGLVRDTSGAVLPGVNVEASSPALIEQVVSVVTDSQGQYKLVNLRPGNYTVVFSLAGFGSVKRAGIELTVGFTAPLNVEMAIGALEEAVTVTGGAPTVDVQNTAVRNVVRAEILSALPTSKSMLALAAVTPGLTMGAAQQDVGGSKGDLQMFMSFHGSSTTDSKLRLNGFDVNSAGGFGRAFVPNPLVDEISVELGGGSAEMATGGIQMNYISRAGGNLFSGEIAGNFTNRSFQGSNLSPELKSRGLTADTMNRIDHLWEMNGGFGGPLKTDKLWFFTTARDYEAANRVAGMYYNATPNTPVYTADKSRPALSDWTGKEASLRLTWQASRRNKFSEHLDWVSRCDCHHIQNGNQTAALSSPEATDHQLFTPEVVWQTDWTHARTSKLLFTGGVQAMWNNIDNSFPSEQGPNAVSITEDTTGLVYGAEAGAFYTHTYRNKAESRAAVNYVTGSHALKAGVNFVSEWGQHTLTRVPSNMNWTFHNGLPVSLTQFTTPYASYDHLNADLGLYMQDQWTIKRLTLNMGLRWDYINLEVPPVRLDTTQFRQTAVDLPPVSCTPCQHDLSPRVSAAYDLFGTGKTALKVSVGKYMIARSAVLFNPVTSVVTSASRQWNDANGNFTPDCDLTSTAANGECQALNNARFGQVNITTTWADDALQNYRKQNWQYSLGVAQEVTSKISLNAGFFRTDWHNFTVTDNVLAGASDYSPYCVTLPGDARLPGGGGGSVCGLYDVNAALFGKVQNVVSRASKFGDQSDVYMGVDVGVRLKLPRGGFVSGGLSAGREEVNTCYAASDASLTAQGFLVIGNSTPTGSNSADFCDVKPPFQPQVKLQGSYPLPAALRIAATFQHLPGIPILASYVASNASVAPSLGRNLSGNVSSVTIANVIRPASVFEDALNQLDLRLSRSFSLGAHRSLSADIDLYNALNASPVLQEVSRYGASWSKPTQTLDARFVKFGGRLTF